MYIQRMQAGRTISLGRPMLLRQYYSTSKYFMLRCRHSSNHPCLYYRSIHSPPVFCQNDDIQNGFLVTRTRIAKKRKSKCQHDVMTAAMIQTVRHQIIRNNHVSTSTAEQQEHEHRLQSKELVTVTESLRQAVEKGELLYDAAQEKAAVRLSKLQKALIGYSNSTRRLILDYWTIKEGQFIKQQQRRLKENNENEGRPEDRGTDGTTAAMDCPNFQVPRGLFLHGHVGTGKTRLMDMFYQTSPIPCSNKKRVHFHSFMQNVHKRIHALKQQDLKENGRNFAIDTRLDRNPIRRVGRQLAEETALLCFDEFQVTDVADALILSQLFEELFRRGTVMVATSNRHPQTLYEGGLNRGYFLPFIDLLCKHCIVHDMNHDVDYRIVTTCGNTGFFYEMTDGENGIQAYHEAIQQICNDRKDDLQQRNVVMNVPYNRTLKVPFMSRNEDMARFHFNDLCKMELGSSDYRAMAQKFNIVMIDEIPVLTLKEHDEARRFITLIDELYEAKCVLLCSAVTSSPDELFVGRRQHTEEEENVDSSFVLLDQQDGFQAEGINVEAGETLGMDVAQSNGMTVGELASVQELSFAFRRAASRIREMTSKSWWEKNI